MQQEFRKFDHPLFTLEYPVGWINITKSPTRFPLKPILAYWHKPERTGFLGILAPIIDIIYWRPDAEFAIYELPLKIIRERAISKTKAEFDEILFNYTIPSFRLSKKAVEVTAKQKENLGGRKLYHLTMNNSGFQSEFRLVDIDEEIGIILRHSTILEKLEDFQHTFERIVQSFKINRQINNNTHS